MFNFFHTNRVAAVLLALAWGVLPLAAGADAAGGAERPVGEVTLSVGPVSKTSAQGLPQPVQRGSRILPGDRLDTADGGHVHIRFIDGALLSVRPGSRLLVEDYRYDPQQLAQSTVRFKLEYGVARAISGAAAEGAKDRFRLNTPLVAIGVRGTDFMVRTQAHATTAVVNQGAIVMAPFDEGCQAQALGPCGSSSARLLSADMGRLLMEYQAQLAHPEIKPLASAVASASDSAVPGIGNGRPVAAAGANGHLGRQDPDGLVTAALVQDAVQSVLDGSVPALPSRPELPVEPPVPPALQWGRWADTALAGDFSIPRVQAREGREVTVGNADFALYRNSGAAVVLPTGLGSYQFGLEKSFVSYNLAGQALAAVVERGQLSIDFGASRFATELQVNNSLTGLVNISGAGYVRGDGIFVDLSVAGQTIGGAAAFDGKSAGYFFEKAVGAGVLSGITFWKRP